MTMFAYPIDLLTIAGFGILGFWLEPINGKQGFIDDLLAPAPLAAAGCIFTALETFVQ
jgi:hypothetical protein